jgi:hypothetical protein
MPSVLLERIQEVETDGGGPALISRVFLGGWVLQCLNAIYAGSFSFSTVLIMFFALCGGRARTAAKGA